MGLIVGHVFVHVGVFFFFYLLLQILRSTNRVWHSRKLSMARTWLEQYRSAIKIHVWFILDINEAANQTAMIHLSSGKFVQDSYSQANDKKNYTL